MDLITSHLKKIDLNLLVAFQSLMEERSVTKAAERLCVSQPAMSKTLNRLRTTFDDQLFESTRLGLIPTARAEELSFPVSSALSLLASSIFEPHFDPKEAVREITIQIPDVFSMALVPSLYARLLRQAPGVRLILDNNTDNHLELLAVGKIDFSIYIEQNLGSEFVYFPLGESPPMCLMRDGHPLNKLEKLSMQDVLAFPMASFIYENYVPAFSPTDQEHDVVQQFLREYRFDETSSLKTRQLLSALAALLETDAVLLGPYLPISIQKAGQRLIAKPIEIISQDFKARLILVQHRRTEKSQLHTWLREQIINSWDLGLPD